MLTRTMPKPTEPTQFKQPVHWVKSLGLAMGGGLILGVMGYRTLKPQHQRRLIKNLGLSPRLAGLARGLARLI